MPNNIIFKTHIFSQQYKGDLLHFDEIAVDQIYRGDVSISILVSFHLFMMIYKWSIKKLGITSWNACQMSQIYYTPDHSLKVQLVFTLVTIL